MTSVYITIDTEYSAGLFKQYGSAGRQENYDRSIRGVTAKGDVGVEYQLNVFDRHGLKAVFFVDPMPALIWGVQAIADIVAPIIERGHDVQLHLHTEWLAFSGSKNPLGNRVGRNMLDFTLEEQHTLIQYATDVLIAAGAPAPLAFRAGNYGANDVTLRALADLGIMYDSSFPTGISHSGCGISLDTNQSAPILHCGVIEVPIGSIGSFNGTRRHAQLTALSCNELISAAAHAARKNNPQFTLVSHSFELMSRDRKRMNLIIKRRFENFCARLAKMPGVKTATYASQPPSIDAGKGASEFLTHNFMRTGGRIIEQLISNRLYGAQ
jgi:hypothetical protein